MHNKTVHQKQQLKVIANIEQSISDNDLNFSTVEPATNYINDPRICLTGVHFPKKSFIKKIKNLILPLKNIDDSIYFYPDSSIHTTIKNLRTISDPPNFDKQVIKKARTVFSQVISQHNAFQAYYYRLMLFPNNLALVGTTDPELDKIVLDLNQRLKQNQIPDDKVYLNEKYFFSNITLCRFTKPITPDFRAEVKKISQSMTEINYVIDSVSLVSANASMNSLNKIQTWQFKK